MKIFYEQLKSFLIQKQTMQNGKQIKRSQNFITKYQIERCYNAFQKKLDFTKLFMTSPGPNDWITILQFQSWAHIKYFRINVMDCANIDIVLCLKWPRLEQLDLSHNKISDVGLIKLTEKSLPHLKILNLQNNKFTEKGCISLIKKIFPKVEKLNLCKNGIDPNQLNEVRNCLSNTMKVLMLDNNNIGTKGVKLLIKAKFPNLEQVQLNHSQLSQCSIKYLTKGSWPLLRILSIKGNFLSLESSLDLSRIFSNKLQRLSQNSKKSILYMQMMIIKSEKLQKQLYRFGFFSKQMEKIYNGRVANYP